MSSDPRDAEIIRLRGELAAAHDRHAREAETASTEMAMRAQLEHRLKLHLEQTPVAALEIDLQHRITHWNPAAERIFGWSTREAIGRNAVDLLVPPPQREPVRALYRRLLQTRSPMGDVNVNIAKDGRSITCEWYNTPLIEDDGEIVAFASLALDVTDRDTALEQVKTSEHRYALALQGTSDGIWDRDLETGAVVFSERFWTMLGYSPEDIEAGEMLTRRVEDWSERVHPDDLEATQQAEQEHLDGRTTHYETTFRMRRKDGSWMWILSRGQALRTEDGRPYRLVGAHTDVDRNIRLEQAARTAMREAEAANRTKSEFLANMSHELRTPLNAVIGFAELLDNEYCGPLNPNQHEYAQHILNSGRHLLDIINDILDLSKIEMGTIELRDEPIEVAKLLEGCLLLVTDRARNGNVTISLDVAAGLPLLNADHLRLKQIFLNLLSNAVKFTPPGGTVSVSASCDRNAGAIALTVADTGIGMTADEVRLAMEPFRQVGAAATREYEGTGLGLPLAKRLAELHGASLRVGSTPGEGTVVTVTFPPQRVDVPA